MIENMNSLNLRSASVLVSIGMVVLFSAMQIGMAVYVIPRFSAIYQDLLGGRPLPSITTMVLNGRWMLLSLGCFFPIAALFVVQRPGPLRFVIPMIGLLVLTLFVTTIALFLPISGTTIGVIEPPR